VTGICRTNLKTTL